MTDKKSFMRAALARKRDIQSLPVPIVPFADWDYYYITEPLIWQSEPGTNVELEQITVPRGFVTDLASIPREFWTLLPPNARYSYPAIIHDYLYWFQICSREQADTILKITMHELDVADRKIFIIYNAVRLAGAAAWNSNAVARESGMKRILKSFPAKVKITWEYWRSQPGVFAE